MLREPIEFSLWDASYNGFFPELTRVVNRCSFAVDSVSIRALDEESPVCLASRHSHWFRFWPMRNYSSTFLRSLRSRPVTALPRYSGRSDSWLARLFGLLGHEHRLYWPAGLPGSHRTTFHAFRHQTPGAPCYRFSAAHPAWQTPWSLSRSGLHLESAGSSLRTAESCSLSYGLHVRLRLLPTSR
jgi:hypothetical protein